MSHRIPRRLVVVLAALAVLGLAVPAPAAPSADVGGPRPLLAALWSWLEGGFFLAPGALQLWPGGHAKEGPIYDPDGRNSPVAPGAETSGATRPGGRGSHTKAGPVADPDGHANPAAPLAGARMVGEPGASPEV